MKHMCKQKEKQSTLINGPSKCPSQKELTRPLQQKLSFLGTFFYYLLENLCLYLNFYVVIILYFCVNGK